MAELDISDRPRRQGPDSSGRDARRAIEDTLQLFGAWRTDLAAMSVQVERRSTRAEIETMLARCATIADEVQRARVGLLDNLIDARQAVASHSHVADVEKALDGIEASVADIRRRLG